MFSKLWEVYSLQSSITKTLKLLRKLVILAATTNYRAFFIFLDNLDELSTLYIDYLNVSGDTQFTTYC